MGKANFDYIQSINEAIIKSNKPSGHFAINEHCNYIFEDTGVEKPILTTEHREAILDEFKILMNGYGFEVSYTSSRIYLTKDSFEMKLDIEAALPHQQHFIALINKCYESHKHYIKDQS